MRRFSLLALAAIAMVGCQSKPSLVGKWSSTSTANGQTANSDWDFEGGKLTMSTEAMGQKIIVKGTYTEADGKMTMTPTDFELPGLPEQFKEQAKRSMDAQKGKPADFKLEHKSADEVVLTPLGAGAPATGATPVVLKRKKA